MEKENTMNWVSNNKPDIGEHRTISKFAWFPVLLDNGFAILFETYIAYQKYSKDYYGEFYWQDIEKFQSDNKGK